MNRELSNAVVSLDEDRLQGTKETLREGQFVLDNQETANAEGFRNVSRTWYDKTISWDDLMESLETSAQSNFDVLVKPHALSLVTEGPQLKLVVDDSQHGGEYEFSQNALRQITGPNYLGLGHHIMEGIPRDDKEREIVNSLFQKRFTDWQTIRAEKDKDVFVRLRRNGDASIRAVLSDMYRVLDHRWVAEVIRQSIPSGRISHFDVDRFWETGGDYVRYNVLIPDSLRRESDSDYGGMQSVSNSEVGTGRKNILPSLFRAICMNGCIWGSVSDERFKISYVHRGKETNYELLQAMIQISLQKAIPLWTEGLEKFVSMKDLLCDGCTAMHVLGSLATSKRLGFTRDMRADLYGAYNEESELGHNAFSVVNAFTRFAQDESLSLYQQHEVETVAGEFVNEWTQPDGKKWELVNRNAQAFDMKKEMVAVAL